MFRSVVSWFKLDLWFCFEKWCVLVERILKNGQKLAISVMLDTPTPRRTRPKVFALFGPPRHSMLRLGEPLYLSIALLRLGVPVSYVLVSLFR